MNDHTGRSEVTWLETTAEALDVAADHLETEARKLRRQAATFHDRAAALADRIGRKKRLQKALEAKLETQGDITPADEARLSKDLTWRLDSVQHHATSARRHHDQAQRKKLKLEALRLARRGLTNREIGIRLSVHHDTARRWIRECLTAEAKTRKPGRPLRPRPDQG